MDLETTLRYLSQDPTNVGLREKAVAAALAAGDTSMASHLLQEYEAIAPLPFPLRNLAGLIALRTSQLEDAETHFTTLLAAHPENPALRANLAWVRARQSDWPSVADLLEGEAATMPQAAALRVLALHHLDRLDEALAWGRALPNAADDPLLMGNLAAVAMDSEDFDTARAYANAAIETAEGLATLGMLELSDNRVSQAEAAFDKALERSPESARALAGKGLAELMRGDFLPAARHLDAAAERFETHLGSFVAAGWAYFLAGDYETSRSRFEAALKTDETFAEIHGGLAVLDVLAGHLDSAQRRFEVARRLDRNAFGPVLAKMLIEQAGGNLDAAEKLKTAAYQLPIGATGQTLGQAVVTLMRSARP